MNPILLIVAATALGVEVGWEPLPDGGHEYTIQIEPQLIEVLQRGDREIYSLVPPELDVRKFRVLVGQGKLPRFVGQPKAVTKSASDVAQHASPPSKTPFDFPAPPAEEEPAKASEDHDPPRAPTTFPLGKSKSPSATSTQAVHTQSSTVSGARVSLATEVEADKPSLPPEPERPWMAFFVTAFLLCCSLSANVYLGWVAWQARQGYRDAVGKMRPGAA